MKRLALITAIVLLILTLLVIVWRLQSVVYIFLVALVITMAAERPIDLLTMRSAPRWLAVLAIYGVAVLVIGVTVAFVLSKLTGEIDPFVQDILTEYGLLQNRLAQLTEARRGILIANLPSTEDVAAMIMTNPDSGIAAGFWAGAGRLVNIFGEIALAIVVAVYWSMDSTRFERLWLSLLPPHRRTQMRYFLGRLERNVGAYVRSEVFQTLLAGALLTVLYLLVGVRYPFLVAALASLIWLIPIFGGVLAVLVAGIIGWFTGWQTAALAAFVTALVLALMEYGVQRRIYHGGHYWGTLVVILMLVLGDAFGVIGLIIAPPVALIVQMMIDAVLDRNRVFGADANVETMVAMRTDLDKLMQRIQLLEVGAHPTIVDLAGRLERLVGEADAGEL